MVLVILVQLDLQVALDLLVAKVYKDLLVQLALQVVLVLQVAKAYKVQLVQLALQVVKVFRVQLVHVDLMEALDL